MIEKLEQNKNLKICILSTYLWGLMAHAYMYFNSAFSIDHLNAYYADSTEEMCKIAGGRFLVPLFRIIRGKTALPWVIGIISLLVLSIVTYFIISLFKVKSTISIILISGFLTTNLTVIATHATYMHELDIDMYALLFACLGIYVLVNNSGIKGMIISASSLYISMGLYQCYASVFITLVILYAIFEVVYHDKSVKESFAGCFKALGSFVIAFLLYSVSSRLICKLADVEVNSSRDVLSNLSVNLISKTADILKLTIKRICLPFSIYNRYLLGMIACFLIAGMLVIIAKKVFSEKKSVREIFYILFLFATLPIAVCSIGIISPYIHDLMIYGIWLLFVFCIVVFDKNTGILKESQEKKRHILNSIIPICALILLCAYSA